MYLALPLVLALLCLILAHSVLRRDYRSFTHRIFTCFLISLGIWGFVIFGMRSSPDLEHAFYWEKGVVIAIILTGIFYYHFTLSYTRTKIPKGLLQALYAYVFIVIALTPTQLWVTRMQVKPYGYAPVFGLAFPLFFISVNLLAIMGMVNLFRAYRASRIYEERNRYIYLWGGTMLSIIGGSFDVLPTLGLPLYPGAIISNIAFCLLTSIAIVRYHLLDINIIVRKGTYYLLMSAIVAVPYTGIIILFYSLFNKTMPMWASLMLLLMLSVSLQPIWQKVQGTVDRLFYRGRYDFLKELGDFSQQIHDITDLNQIAAPLVKLVSRALQASSAHLLLPSSSGKFEVVSSTGRKGITFTLESHSPLIWWLQAHGSILHRPDIDIIQQLQSLTDKETKHLNSINAELLFPLKTKENELVGLLIIGEKLSGQTYSEEDERLVLTIASRMAIELENALLYAREKATREELQRQNEQKTEFLHTVAHELKTPLTAVISSSELLSSELTSQAGSPIDRLVNNITHSAWSMDKRITELLDFARIQIGALKLQPQELEIRTSIEQVTSVLQVLFKNKGQSLRLDIPPSLPPARADKDKLEQVLVNLLSNANKFSPDGGYITVRAKEDKVRIIVEVEDSAKPITEKEKKRLFEPYYRGEDGGKILRLPGLGLGLSISKRLIEMQQGELWVQTPEGKGNIFAFSVPISKEKTAELTPLQT